MKLGESSPEESGLGTLADRKAEQYIAKEQLARALAIEARLQSLYSQLGLGQGQTLKDYLGLVPKTVVSEPDLLTLNPHLDQTIDDLFDDIFLLLTQEDAHGDASKILGSPRTKENKE